MKVEIKKIMYLNQFFYRFNHHYNIQYSSQPLKCTSSKQFFQLFILSLCILHPLTRFLQFFGNIFIFFIFLHFYMWLVGVRCLIQGWEGVGRQNQIFLQQSIEKSKYRNKNIFLMSKSSCYECGERGHFARECPRNRKNRVGMTCFNCGGIGHMARQCPSESFVQCQMIERESRRGISQPKCYNCNQYGHYARQCHGIRSKACYNCHKGGHIARDCPEGDRKKNMECHKCHQLGHFSKECPRNLE